MSRQIVLLLACSCSQLAFAAPAAPKLAAPASPKLAVRRALAERPAAQRPAGLLIAKAPEPAPDNFVLRGTKALLSVIGYSYAFWAILLSVSSMLNLHTVVPAVEKLGFKYGLDTVNEIEMPTLLGKLGVDGALLTWFTVSHSLLARLDVKAALGLGAFHRVLYIFNAAITVHALHAFWQPFAPAVVWSLSGNAETAAYAGYAGGLLWLMSSTFAIDHAELFGLRGGFGYDFYGALGIDSGADKLISRLHYAVVRHPLMLGFFVMFFSVPTMTQTHLLFSLGATAYILAAVSVFEEPRLRETVGKKAYDAYSKVTPKYFPGGPH